MKPHALTEEAERAAIHYRAGQVLAALDSATRRDELLFETVSHFNRAAGVIESADERRAVAALNLQAASRAKGAIAFDAALTYLSAGIASLGADAEAHDPVLPLD